MAEQGSWWGLRDVLLEARQYAREDRARGWIACPNDGEPLQTGPDGHLFCPYDGFRPANAPPPQSAAAQAPDRV